MDKLAHYRTSIKNLLQEQAQYKPYHGEIEPMLVFDEERDHYQLLYLGWDRRRRVHAIIIHMRLYQGKIRIEYNGTEVHVAQELVEAGVAKDDIVLAFHPPIYGNIPIMLWRRGR